MTLRLVQAGTEHGMDVQPPMESMASGERREASADITNGSCMLHGQAALLHSGVGSLDTEALKVFTTCLPLLAVALPFLTLLCAAPLRSKSHIASRLLKILFSPTYLFSSGRHPDETHDVKRHTVVHFSAFVFRVWRSKIEAG
jgi:hypothetical protein